MPQCPICQKYIQIKAGESPDTKVNEHISRGCKGGELRKPDKRVCSIRNCVVEEMMPVICKGCKKNFCLKHRYPRDHDCIEHKRMLELKEQERIRKEKKKAEIASKIKGKTNKGLTDTQRLKRLQRKNKQNSKVQAMRARMRATGNKNVQEKDRFYLEIEFGEGLKKKKPLSMWFNRRHTVGRIMDDICAAASITNRNNVKGARRLYLLSKSSGVALPTDVSLSLLEPEVSNGHTIVLAYEDESS